MFTKAGGLINYWHIIAFTKDLKKNKSLKRTIYNKSLLIWRDSQNNIHSILNCCAHKRAPLSVKNYSSNQLICPYHGWSYDKEGKLEEIPSSPNLDKSKLNCKIDTFQVIEKNGFIWVYLNSIPTQKKPPELCENNIENWGNYFIQKTFNTSEELLIENFMDTTHTTTIHKGIIRENQIIKEKHTVNVSTNENGVCATFNETKEKIAFGLQFFLGKNMRVKHSDEFLLPNIVRVKYFINDIYRFNAFIACTPTTEGSTQAYVRLSYNFKFANPLIKVILPYYTRKVLRQDYKITSEQYKNQLMFSEIKEKHVEVDKIHNKVLKVRKSAIDGHEIVKSSNKIEIHL